jgi:CRP-like cAMP-binding protein
MMSFSLLNQYLQSVYPISPGEFDAITRISEVFTIHKNELLQPIGHRCQTIYFLNEGCARIFYFKEETDITESFAFEKQIVVRVESLFRQQPSKKGIQLLEDAELIGIQAPALFRLYDAYPSIERLFRKVFEGLHVDTINRMESLQFHSAEERYRHLLEESPDLIRRIPLKYIASYLGITQTSLSRIRSQYCD